MTQTLDSAKMKQDETCYIRNSHQELIARVQHFVNENVSVKLWSKNSANGCYYLRYSDMRSNFTDFLHNVDKPDNVSNIDYFRFLGQLVNYLDYLAQKREIPTDPCFLPIPFDYQEQVALSPVTINQPFTFFAETHSNVTAEDLLFSNNLW